MRSQGGRHTRFVARLPFVTLGGSYSAWDSEFILLSVAICTGARADSNWATCRSAIAVLIASGHARGASILAMHLFGVERFQELELGFIQPRGALLYLVAEHHYAVGVLFAELWPDR